jgi:hypothetical protein
MIHMNMQLTLRVFRTVSCSRKGSRDGAHGRTLDEAGDAHKEQPRHGEENEQWQNACPEQPELLAPADLPFFGGQCRSQMRLKPASDDDVKNE